MKTNIDILQCARHTLYVTQIYVFFIRLQFDLFLVSCIYSTVLDRLVEELKQILRRDFQKRMIENVAYKSFENWWSSNEKQLKVNSDRLLNLRKDIVCIKCF